MLLLLLLFLVVVVVEKEEELRTLLLLCPWRGQGRALQLHWWRRLAVGAPSWPTEVVVVVEWPPSQQLQKEMPLPPLPLPPLPPPLPPLRPLLEERRCPYRRLSCG